MMDSLTERERDVIKALLAGYTDSESVATQLKPTPRSGGEVTEQVARHLISNALSKTGCRDKLQLALWAVRSGFPITWTGPVNHVPQGWEQDGLFGE